MQDQIEALNRENRKLGIRLQLAQAFVGMLTRAYDALLHHGVNYRDLKEYKDNTAILDEAGSLPITEGRSRFLSWMARVESGITAAIRRKTFRRLDS